MSPPDIRLLIEASGLSNREVASALDMTDDRMIRRWKSGDEAPSAERVDKLIDIVADKLAGQLIRALEIAADGRVEVMRLIVNPDKISLDGIESFSQMTQLALRSAFTARLMQRGLKIERDDR